MLFEEYQRLEEMYQNQQKLNSRVDGIPAVLIVEDYFGSKELRRSPAPGDEALGISWAVLATAIAAVIEKNGWADKLTPVCPAMSVIAVNSFGFLPYESRLDFNELECT